METQGTIFGREPAVIIGFILAIISFVAILGLELPQGIEAGISGLITAGAALGIRSQVYSPVTHEAEVAAAKVEAALDED